MAKRKNKSGPPKRKPPSRKANGKSKKLFNKFPNGKRKFLEALNKSGFIVDALKECKLDRLTFEDWRRKDEKFSQRVDEVEASVRANLTDELEKETFKRASKGWPGREGEQKYSPGLQRFMLEAHKPGVYHAGDATNASPEELAQRVRIALQVIAENSGIGKPAVKKTPNKPPRKRKNGNRKT